MRCEAAWISLILLAMVAYALWFRRTQNRRTRDGTIVGGEISWPKAFWLGYALGAWFLMPFVFVGSPSVDPSLKYVLWLHLASWWIRGPLELVMIYRWFNWSPIHGISHDSLHNTLIFGATAVAAACLGDRLWAPANLIVTAFLTLICFSMMAEVSFAALFIATRGPGAEKIYFASDAPEYRLINRLTQAVCFIVYASVIALGLACLFGAPSA